LFGKIKEFELGTLYINFYRVPNPHQFGFTSGSEIVENTKIKKNSSILDVLF